jgi:cytochrome P450
LAALKEKSNYGKNPVEMGYDINVSVVNIIWSIVSGEKKSHDDPRIREFLIAINKGLELASTSGILLFMPFLAKIFPESLFGIDQMRKWKVACHNYLQEVIDNHKKIKPSGDPRDFIEAFLAEMAKDNVHPSFNDFQLLVLCSDLFGAGGEPTSVVLKWAIRYLAMYPEIMRKAQHEIDTVVGLDRPIQFADRHNLPYVQALLMDLIRIADIHPVGVVHSASEDVELDGYLIPKGAFIFPNLHHVHHDPAYWEKPNELYPEHWLDSNGNFISKREGFIAFGVGKRKCPGQEVAQMELFAFLTNLLRNFTFKLTPEDSGKIEPTAGIVVSPKTYPIILEPRETASIV